jgi:cysteinyl-tRNA synthetase
MVINRLGGVEMAGYTQNVTQLSDKFIDGIRQVDEFIVNTTSAVTQKVGEILPDELPGASTLRTLPRPEELVKTYFEFIERLVKTQRTYSLDLAKAFEPITGKIWKPVRKAQAA